MRNNDVPFSVPELIDEQQQPVAAAKDELKAAVGPVLTSAAVNVAGGNPGPVQRYQSTPTLEAVDRDNDDNAGLLLKTAYAYHPELLTKKDSLRHIQVATEENLLAQSAAWFFEPSNRRFQSNFQQHGFGPLIDTGVGPLPFYPTGFGTRTYETLDEDGNVSSVSGKAPVSIVRTDLDNPSEDVTGLREQDDSVEVGLRTTFKVYSTLDLGQVYFPLASMEWSVTFSGAFNEVGPFDILTFQPDQMNGLAPTVAFERSHTRPQYVAWARVTDFLHLQELE